jgi:hypothetical protein
VQWGCSDRCAHGGIKRGATYDALTTLTPTFMELYESRADEPLWAQRLDALQSLVFLKFRELQTSIELRQQSGFGAAQKLTMTNEGKRTMDRIRKLIGEFRSDEARAFSIQESRVQDTVTTARISFFAATLAGLGLLMYVLYTLWLYLIEVRKTERTLRRQALRDPLTGLFNRRFFDAGLEQEIWALLALYQLLRMAMTDATATRPGTDPDRASFSIALQAARDQIIQAANVLAGTVIDLAGVIGRAVLDHPMPTRRLRVSPRAVKRPLSRYAYKSLRVDRRTYTATISIDILTGQPGP